MSEDVGIYVPADRWLALRAEPSFHELLRLARVVNALSLAYGPILHPLEDQGPRARRERSAAMAYMGALLHEGLHAAQSLGAHFRHLPQYRDLATILGDPGVQRLRSNLLDKLRDQLVFHFDRASIATGLQRFPEGEALIGTTSDGTHGQIYYDIGDDVLTAYLFGDAATEADFLGRVSGYLEETVALFNRFVAASHSLIGAALREMGCFQRAYRRPTAPPAG